MALSPNYGWSEPDNSSLVKNGAADIRTLGDSIDTSVWNIGFGQSGKNKIINGDFGIWQRGTSGFGFGAAYNADRWAFYRDGSGATEAITQQTFTPGAAPVAGYEGQYFWRYAATVAGTGGAERSFYQKIEDVRTFAGQTVTVSFWAKADAARTISISLAQNFGSGGSATVTTSLTSQSVTTSWARYSASVAVPSISGKTVGTSSYLQLTLGFPINVTETIDIWGVQLEYGSKATPFETASGGSPQAELAMCQRYYWRQTAVNANERAGYGSFYGSTGMQAQFNFPVTMRSQTTAVEIVGVSLNDTAAVYAVTSGSVNVNSPFQGNLNLGIASGGTQFRYAAVTLNTAGSSYIGFSAEL